MKKYVLDAHAIMVFLEKEPGYEKIVDLFATAANSDQLLDITVVNAGEVLYIVLRESGEKAAREIESILHQLPIQMVPVDFALSKRAGRFKAFHKMSYADCFAAALAADRKARLVTGDPEFKSVEGDISIEWIGRR